MQNKVTKLKRTRKTDWSPQKVAEYSSIINAQHANFMIGPKILLPLSVACIGLLIGLSNNFSFSSNYQLTAFVCSIFVFFMTILFIFGIYGCKFDLLDIKEKLFNNTESKDILLKKEDKANTEHKRFGVWISVSFMLAILSMITFGIIAIYKK